MMIWIETINKLGRRNVAEGSGTTYEAVRQWTAGLTFPRGKNRERLLEYVKTKVSPEEYDAFKGSLVDSLLGGSSDRTQPSS